MLICSLFGLLTAGVATRLVHLQVTNTDFLQAQGDARTLRIVDIPSYRGMITDRRGTPIAISTPVHAIYVNPSQFSAKPTELKKLAKLLGYTSADLKKKIEQHPHRVFIYLKRGLTPDIAKQIKALNITGLGIKREFRRYYPAAWQTAQLTGFTDIDDQGQAGLELTFEQALKPTIGKKRVLEDRTGRWVKDLDYFQPARSGDEIALSIDLRIQGFAYRELEQAIQKYQAKSATLVMIDISTGEILAMVSAPSFNPNNRQECHGAHTRNRALTDLYEPGSTIKTFTITSALASREFTPESIIDTSPGTYRIGKHLVRDIHPNGVLTLKEVLSKSSNVGISKITLALPPETLLETFRQLGLGDSINTPFPGERKGMLPPPPKNPFMHATLAFGYGLSVTPLQLAHAYATLASGGIKIPVSLTKLPPNTVFKKERVIPEDVALSTLQVLTEVISRKGTGSRADIPGYKTAGKTGTVRVVGPHGYDPNRHIALFAGITPVDQPRLATVIVVEEPNEKNYYGGLVAAPIYRNVVGKALYLLNVPPDNTA
ncbi:peptidoglycan D,D-transpeptidase FtsI family protein [Candidatus Berkiella aquae]|nr:penicillin-binding transpeptidase domain-containing protein [Candidatus Berkiella aquae]MCS5710354.1 penicillin-binding protein 2 [Candidatus Berkiella aquae]